MNKLWYKNAVIYSLDVELFRDSNGDGVGDFPGLIERLHYLAGLGVDCVWLQPFYDSPNKDDGYDVSDYYEVDKRLGDLGHFAALVDAADEVGIRIIIDLVVNHTSKEHPWFQQARKSRESKYRDYYIWSDHKPEDDGEHAVLEELQDHSNWEYDRSAKKWYYHTFFPHQPDLNISNPDVRDEIIRVMHFWLKLGISGFRIDATPHMFREKGSEKFKGDPLQILRDFREFTEIHNRDAVLLAEVDVDPKEYGKFFGNQDKMHMLFDFFLNNSIFLALARGKAIPIRKALRKLPKLGEREQMANFLRNHDELNLSQLSEKEKEEVFSVFAPEERMRIFDHGIRRRLAPMLSNDRKKLEMAYSLLLSLPGTPVIRYGQELGMGENLALKGRESVRTPMQWDNGKNGGFSEASEAQLVKAVLSEGDFGYKKLNVTDQHRNPESMLNWMGRCISFRKEMVEIGYGKWEIEKVNNPSVLALSFHYKNRVALILHNFSDKEITVSLQFTGSDKMLDVFGDEKYEQFDPKSGEIKLSGFGYRWIRKRNIF
ncbi:maltose alpha-D-glucosyltransferase/alpha-amylase [Algoriphagus sp. 4150]|uniref:alpha-amylase family protein n=1 Tax=Algoriphagus sp. 4150 TaxID=2817756 RepID=UPI00285C8F52|nr:alpha-amylase family protein [Algoriphagus sp. 4150]MDR7127866.1 maltose alpha-D-glucosyltransferase/alpha-amylase [Algoriphagus sp. 4150]